MSTVEKKTKLILWMDRSVADYGKQWAKDHSSSLSELFEDFLITLRLKEKSRKLSPRLARMSGILKGRSPSKKDYYNYLEKKYLRK